MSNETTLLVFFVLILFLTLLASWVFFLRRLRLKVNLEPSNYELTVLAEIEQVLASTPIDLDEISEIVYVEMTRLVEIDHFQLGLFENDRYRTILCIQNGKRVENREYLLYSEKQGLVEWLRETGQSLLITDFNSKRETPPFDLNSEIIGTAVSGLFVPLSVGEEVIGILTVQSHKKQAFSQSHQRILTILSNFLASSIALVLLNDEAKFYKQQLIHTEGISRLLISSKPLDVRLSSTLPLIKETFVSYAVGLYKYEEEEISLLACLPEDSLLPLIDPVDLKEIAANGNPQSRYGIPSISLDDNDRTNSHLNREIISELIVPLIAEEHLLGVLQLIHRGDLRFSPEQYSHAEMICANLAMAMLEDRNYNRQQEDNWITTVLLEVARHAAQPGNIEEALQAVLQLTILLTGKQWAFLLIPDEIDETLRAGASAGFSRQIQYQLFETIIPLSVFASILKHRMEMSVEVPLPPILADLVGAADAIVLPLASNDTILGLFIVEGKVLQERQKSLIIGIANQITLRLENTRLVERVAIQRSLERELQTARAIQETFLPRIIPHHPGWEINAVWRVARDVGGDFYDFIPLHSDADPPRWGIVIADVTDKGIPAALYMALCRTLLRSVAISRVDPGSTLTRLNQLLFADTQADMLVSVFYAVWEPEEARFSYANAGHNPPLLFRPQQPARVLRDHGIVLGATLEAKYTTHVLHIQPGELIVLYTDGVTETSDSQRQLFGLHRLESLVLGLGSWNAEKVTNQILQRVEDFCGSNDLQDDLTTVVIYRSE